jgi:hypothetical protein
MRLWVLLHKPWHEYIGRLVSKDSEFLTKSVMLKLIDLTYNSIDFEPIQDGMKLRSSYRFTFTGKNLILENIIRKLENEKKLNLNWKKKEFNKFRKASLYFAISECNANINYLKNKLPESYVKRDFELLKKYDSEGYFRMRTRKASSRQIKNAPYRKFHGIINHW